MGPGHDEEKKALPSLSKVTGSSFLFLSSHFIPSLCLGLHQMCVKSCVCREPRDENRKGKRMAAIPEGWRRDAALDLRQ